MHFRPFPFLDNPHVQTVMKNVLPAPKFRYAAEQRLVLLEDGDQLVLHDTTPPEWKAGDPIVIIVHGLSGCHASTNVVALSHLLIPHGLRVARLDLRGAGAGMHLARKTYNAACSHDVRAAVLAMHAVSPTSPIVLVGFSLGGNIVLKLGGEAATQPLPGLARIAAVSAPIDMTRCAALLAQPINRLYDAYFTSRLVRLAMQLQQNDPDMPPVRFPSQLRLRGFDDLYTAPRGGFAGALDYYQRSSAMHLLPHIRVPAFLLTARDDPFIAVESYRAIERKPDQTVQITEHGGHLGFIGRDGKGGFRWMEQRLLRWIIS